MLIFRLCFALSFMKLFGRNGFLYLLSLSLFIKDKSQKENLWLLRQFDCNIYR